MLDHEFPSVHVKLLTVAFSKCRNHAVSEDIVSTVVLRLLPQMADLSVSEYTAIGIVAVGNMLKNMHRDNAKFESQASAAIELDVVEQTIAEYDLQEEQEHMEQVMGQLNARQTNLVSGLIVGLRRDELTERLDISRATYYREIEVITDIAEATA